MKYYKIQLKCSFINHGKLSWDVKVVGMSQLLGDALHYNLVDELTVKLEMKHLKLLLTYKKENNFGNYSWSKTLYCVYLDVCNSLYQERCTHFLHSDNIVTS